MSCYNLQDRGRGLAQHDHDRARGCEEERHASEGGDVEMVGRGRAGNRICGFV
jgi:hypothetical protein